MKENEQAEWQSKLQGSLKDAQGLADEFKKVQEHIKAFMTPIEQKNIVFDGVNCVIQLYQDRIAIVLPLKEQPVKYYNELGGLYDKFEKEEQENLRLIDANKQLRKLTEELTKDLAEAKLSWWAKFIKRTK